MEHLEENTIVGYVGRGLSVDDRRRVEEHIDVCPECRQLLAFAAGGSHVVTHDREAPREEHDTMFEGQPQSGDRIANRFLLGRVLGRGGMGCVFQATDDALAIQVALKVLRPQLTRDEGQVRHLRREILAGRRISHPNVCRVFDLGKSGRLYFITMELITGVTIAERLRSGPVAVGVALDIVKQLLSALAAAHAAGIVHRDLKPANVMLDATGRLKVMDFGLARDLRGQHSLAGHVGTPAYWSPEQARGEAAGPESDLYAVGLIAYMLFTADLSVRNVRQRLRRIPTPFRAWVARCIEEEPTDRFPDARTAAGALAELPSTTRGSTGRLAIAGGAIAAVAAVGSWWLVREGDESRSSPAAPPPSDAGLVVDAAMLVDAANDAPNDAPIDAPIDAPARRAEPPISPIRPTPTRDAGIAPRPETPASKRDDSSPLYE